MTSKAYDVALRQQIHDAILTFRIGAVLCVDDVRFASHVDGHPLNAVDSRIIQKIIDNDCSCVLLDERSPSMHLKLWRRIK